MRTERLEEAPVNGPTIEKRLVFATEIGLARGRQAIQQLSVRSAPEHDAGVAVAGGQHAETAGLEVERVGRREPGERVQGNN